jgi:23S rRNA (uridine2552-2'-O)-methyltransferase
MFVMKIRNFSLNSKTWLQRQNKDIFVKAANKQGLRSRAAFKLLEIQHKYKIIQPHHSVLDLGSAPGSWSVSAAELLNDEGLSISVDLLAMEAIPYNHFIQGDFTDAQVQQRIIELSQNRKFDVILSDMLHNTTGHKSTDQSRSMNICYEILDFAHKFSTRNGCLLMKFLRCSDDKDLTNEVQKLFKEVKIIKPSASRSESSEAYILARHFNTVAS